MHHRISALPYKLPNRPAVGVSIVPMASVLAWRGLRITALCVVVGCWGSWGFGQEITEVVAFGASQQVATSTNGPSYVDYLAQELGVPIKNFADGSAGGRETRTQVDRYLQSNRPNSGTLLISGSWGMGPDLLREDSVETVISRTVEIISTLVDAGGVQIIIANDSLFPLLAPALRNLPNATQLSSDLELAFDEVSDKLRGLQLSNGISPHFVDRSPLYEGLSSNPSSVGFVNGLDPVEDPEMGASEYFWWDDIHWTTAGHRVVSDFTLAMMMRIPCDFDANSECNGKDIDRLGKTVNQGNNPVFFDMTMDGLVDQTDIDEFLRQAGLKNGDLNFDGLVSFEDFLLFAANFGLSDRKWSDGDLIVNGSVDFEDFLVLAANFGMTNSDGTMPVPEPNCMSMIIAGLIGLAAARKRWSPSIAI